MFFLIFSNCTLTPLFSQIQGTEPHSQRTEKKTLSEVGQPEINLTSSVAKCGIGRLCHILHGFFFFKIPLILYNSDKTVREKAM